MISLPPYSPAKSHIDFNNIKAIFLVAVFGITCLYVNTLNSPFYFDDYFNIVENHAIRLERADVTQVKKLLRENYTSQRPISFITFAINYLAGDLHPFGYHIVNILIHVFNAWLVFFVVFRTLVLPSVRMKRKEALSVAGITVLLWSLHPIQTNVTVYIVQRMVSLATLFFLLSFLFYIQGRLLFHRVRAKSIFLFFFSLLFGLFALMSKPNTIFLPFLIIVYDGLFFPGKNKKKIFIAGLIGSLLIGVALFWWIGGADRLEMIANAYKWRHFSLKERLLTEMRVVFFYLKLLFLANSDHLTLFYDEYAVSKSLWEPISTLFSFLGLMGIGCSVIWAAFHGMRVYVFGVLWYFLNIFVESSFFPLELVFEHRTYLPSIGVFFIISFWVVQFISSHRKRKELVIFLLFTFLLFESFGVMLRNRYWSTRAVFHEDALRKAPGSPRILADLYKVYTDLKAYEVAQGYLEVGLEKHPNNINILAGYYVLLRDLKKEEKAKEILSRIDQLLKNGEYYSTDLTGLNVLMNVFFNVERNYEKGLEYAKYGLKVDASAERYYNLGCVYLNLSQLKKALECFKITMEKKPNIARCNFYMGITHRALEEKKEAAHFIKRSLSLFPDTPLIQEMYGLMKIQRKAVEQRKPHCAAHSNSTLFALPCVF